MTGGFGISTLSPPRFGIIMEVRPPENGFPALTPEEFAALPHDDLGPTLVATSWACVGLALVFIALRVYCKLTRRRVLWWDDHFLIMSWVSPVPPSTGVSKSMTGAKPNGSRFC